MSKPALTEAAFERLIDKRVMKRLASDPAYLNAETSDDQEAVEEQIVNQEIASVASEYDVEGFNPDWNWT